MAQKQTGNGWTVEVDGNTMIWEFLPGMELSAFREDAFPVYQNLLAQNDIEGMVTDVQIDDPFNSDVFEVWEQSAAIGEEEGLQKWAVVADGIKSISLGGKVDTGGLDTLTTEDRSEAIEWVQ